MGMPKYHAVNGRLGRILIVDDEPEVRKPIVLSLLDARYEVVEANNGEQAIEALKAEGNALMVDTILCDIRMPKINGIETVSYFRTHYPAIPVVVLTGYPDVELAVCLMKRGVLDYLVKPVPMEELMTVIKEAVEQHRLFMNQFVA